ncbi:MAG: prolyl oligopeptidase family serine peptidase [Gammaproteobacteria bacterium]|nr:prolyl oligopeptidase family serine peptidase [Gammaproteobacteria bacterium]
MRGIEDIIQLAEVDGKNAQKWVKNQNKKTRKALDQTQTYRRLYAQCADADAKSTSILIPKLSKNGQLRKIHTDEKNPRGILKQTNRKSFLSVNQQWKALLDIDALARNEKKDWEFKRVIEGVFNNKTYTLILLNEGGSDKFVAREFDLKTKRFVENGFSIPNARSKIAWYSADTLLIASDFGEGSLTKSDYPRSIRLLKRHQAINEAEKLFEVPSSHLKAHFICHKIKKTTYYIYEDCIDLHHSTFNLVYRDLKCTRKLPIPDDSDIKICFQHNLLFSLCSDWNLNKGVYFNANCMIGVDLKKFQEDANASVDSLDVRLWLEPHCGGIEDIITDGDNIFIITLKNMAMQLFEIIKTENNIRTKSILFDFSGYNFINTLFINQNHELFFYQETWTQPRILYIYNINSHILKVQEQESPYFQASCYQTQRLSAISQDGTCIPYFLVAKKNIKHDGMNPVILSGYGGFSNCHSPSYLGHAGVALLEKGFIYVNAHIRGGGEYGAQWHKDGSLTKKQNSFDDFIAVAEDLIRRKLTSNEFLGIQGNSNGGLLVAACATQRPDLFKAVFCEIPLIDMLHYHTLLVGHSWIGEYGNPDNPDMRKMLTDYSPLHHLDAQQHYPKMLIETSKTDDRVHPYHARAMAYQLQKLKKPVHFFERKTGGHSGGEFNDLIRQYTYWHLQLLIPAQRKRSRDEAENNAAGFFQNPSRHAPCRRLEAPGMGVRNNYALL